MCGIAGFWQGPRRASGEELTSIVDAMSRTMDHRGPDDSGAWSDPAAGIAFGFRRLAIVDLSEHGHQPMRSRSDRFRLVFNGEVYNHIEIAEELRTRGHTFDGHSDTAVILAAFEEWGIEAALPRFVGMFAMAVWDTHARTLTLIRDRLGIKPLYVYQKDGVVAFASELKAVAQLPVFDRAVDPDAVEAYFRYMYVPAPHTIYRHARKLLPGHTLTIADPSADLPPSVPFWSLQEIARASAAHPFAGGDREATDLLEELLLDAVRLRLRADVPVGAFLSGGIDSSTVVALMQEVASRPVQTFTIAFDVAAHDESAEAEAIASHLGTDHHTIAFSGDDAQGVIPLLPAMFDEPHADPSQLPTYLICHAARQRVTVAISGDGGDELFAGYNRYSHGSTLMSRLMRAPVAPRRLLGMAMTRVPPSTWDRAQQLVRRGRGHRLFGQKAHKFGRLMQEESTAGMYRSLMSAWSQPPVAAVATQTDRMTSIFTRESLSLLDRMMLTDQLVYLPDDLLAKVDRTSMAVSLEVRVPILDHRVVELSWRLPERMKLREGTGKWILREVLARRVPRPLFERPKMGFTVPLAEWLRGPLRSWASDLLSAERLGQSQHLDVPRIQRAWNAFLRRETDDHLQIWTVLMFEAWREQWRGS